jgi:para-nitrobenzyl esterase
VGALRWKAPRPALPWSGTRNALAFGGVAPQFAGAAILAPKAQWDQVVGQEDCLTLNIFAPRFVPSAVPQGGHRLPVMVWIHGGANTVGASATYRTVRNTAREDGVIVVTVNYRLGVLGWFNLPEMHDSDASPEDRSGNYGTLDLITALRWVRDHISAFGGDPDQVTIYGESAGALNVYTLLASPMATGLFHRAIAQSPLAVTSTPEEGSNFVDDAVPGKKNSARELVCEWLQREGRAATREAAKQLLAAMPAPELRAYVHGKTPAELLAPISSQTLGFYDSPRIFRDGLVVAKDHFHQLFANPQNYNAVPLIVGCNRDEYRLFMAGAPEHVEMRLSAFPIIKDPARYERTARYMSDLWRAGAVNLCVSQMVAGGHKQVWAYRFDWDEQPDIPFVHPPRLIGAAHAVEMSFVFRDVVGESDALRSNSRTNRPGRQHVSDAMAGYWAQFAHIGAPGRGKQGTLPEWPRWGLDAAQPRLMVFDTPTDGGVRMSVDALSVDEVRQRLAADTTIATARERCELYSRMYLWSEFAPHPRENELARFADGACALWTADELKPLSWP